jgi:hypothetical protein
MNAGPTSERILEATRKLVAGTRFQPGERVEPAVLALELGASATPVREALNRLVGERLLVSQTGGGFRLPRFDEPALRDLYGWSLDLLLLCLKSDRRHAGLRQMPLGRAPRADYPERVMNAFCTIIAWSGSFEHAAAMDDANLRLHGIRLCETAVLPGCDTEIDEIEAAIFAPGPALRSLLIRYHRRRSRAAAEILRKRYRPD